MKHILIALLLFPVLTLAQIRGKVVAVADGDTFTMLTAGNKQIKVRLHGIDCPEKKQDYGSRAKWFTSDLVYGRTVEVQQTDKDRYGRMVAIVTLPDGSVLNERLLKAGLAWHYVRYDNRPEWSAMELQARRERLGLWELANAVPPWEFRRQKR